MVDPSTASALKYVATILSNRAIIRGAEGALIYLSASDEGEVADKRLSAQIEAISGTIESLNGKVDTLILRPLRSGMIKFSEVGRLPKSLQSGALAQALSDFNDAAVLSYDGKASNITAAQVRCLALFGKAAVLEAADADADLVSETLLDALKSHPETASMFVAQSHYDEIIRILYRSESVLQITYAGDKPKCRDERFGEYTATGIVEVIGRNFKSEDNFNGFSFRKTLRVPSGLVRIRISSKIEMNYSSFSGHLGTQTTTVEWSPAASKEVQAASGMINDISISLNSGFEKFVFKDDRHWADFEIREVARIPMAREA